MKLGIVIGHNAKRQGAQAVVPIGASEFKFNSVLADIMHDMSSDYGLETKIFTRRSQSSPNAFRKEITEVYSKTDAWGADATIELHFNAYNGRVRGTETLSGPSATSLLIASEVQERVADLYGRSGRTDRGVKRCRRGMRGCLSLSTGKAPAILVEPFFGDAIKEAEMAFRIGKPALARAYLGGIASALGVDIENLEDENDAGPTGEAAELVHIS